MLRSMAITGHSTPSNFTNRLSEAGIRDGDGIQEIAEKTLTDLWAGGKPQITEQDEVMKILNMVQ